MHHAAPGLEPNSGLRAVCTQMEHFLRAEDHSGMQLEDCSGDLYGFCETESNHANDTDSGSEIVFLDRQF